MQLLIRVQDVSYYVVLGCLLYAVSDFVQRLHVYLKHCREVCCTSLQQAKQVANSLDSSLLLLLAQGWSHPSGDAYVPVFREGPWAVKKSLQSLIDRLPGFHIDQASVNACAGLAANGLARGRSHTWSVPNAELHEGKDYINERCPPCDANSEQYIWILENIKEDSGSPIAGWPETKVTKMAMNKAKTNTGAVPKKKFPLNTFSMKPVMHSFLMPMLFPLLMNFAILLLGWPKVGKTPGFIIMAMAMGRFHLKRLEVTDKSAGWRRAKSLDNFRHIFAQIWEAVFLDDPSRAKVDIDELKSFVTVDEDQTCSARYNDVQLCKNGTRGYAVNDIRDEDEPASDDRTKITKDEFYKLISKAFQGDARGDVNAVLKRSITFVFGKRALYLRLPGADEEQVIHRIMDNDVHLDILAEHDKPYYNKFKTYDIYEDL